MNKTISRYIIETAIITGMLSIFIAIVQKLTHLSSIYVPQFLGLTPADFLTFGQICFMFAIAFAVRRILKHLEYALRSDRIARKERGTPAIS